jgi:hypothetical protein
MNNTIYHSLFFIAVLGLTIFVALVDVPFLKRNKRKVVLGDEDDVCEIDLIEQGIKKEDLSDFNSYLLNVEDARIHVYVNNKYPDLLSPERALRAYLLILHHEFDEQEYPNIVRVANSGE